MKYLNKLIEESPILTWLIQCIGCCIAVAYILILCGMIVGAI